MDDSTQPPARNVIIAFVVIALAIVGGTVLLLVSRPQPVTITINPPVPTATAAPTATPDPITVYITGAVGTPRTEITLPAGSRVRDAIEAAGGWLDDADLDRVNMALILRDGDQVHVPLVDELVTVATPNTSGLIRINTATSAELETLPGIGPALAERILTYRTENGPFTSLADLDNVSGIGPAMLEQLEGLIAFD
jgi:competence protein ComEA